jgi:hypothetical protein
MGPDQTRFPTTSCVKAKLLAHVAAANPWLAELNGHLGLGVGSKKEVQSQARHLDGGTLFIVASDRHTGKRMPLFGDVMPGSAAMDRLEHNAHIVELTGAS